MTQRATESIVVSAPPEVVYRVVTDFEHYTDWVSDLKRIEVLERDATGRALEVEFRAAAFGRSTTYALRYDYDRAPETLAWHQTSGDLTSSLDGEYRFDAEGQGTLLTYDLEVELLVPIPAFIRSRAAHRIQSQALRELKVQAERAR
ncbi:MAG TPA: SRPBCC family protein [Acidimicrobiales bacterium]|nr:SRPBCC family protein [Acidimicrobiales bacterium]